MECRVLADKLLDLSKGHANIIADQWYKAISTNSRTRSFHTIPRQKLTNLAISFLENLKKLYVADNLYQEVSNYLDRIGYAEITHNSKIPLTENIYGLVLLRRHVWLHADTQAMFNTSLDLFQAIECINRTILVFDYSICIVTQKYTQLSTKS
jgi:hypothetical protein